MKIPKKRSISLRYVLLGITYQASPQATTMQLRGLKTPKLYRNILFNLVLIKKCIDFSKISSFIFPTVNKPTHTIYLSFDDIL